MNAFDFLRVQEYEDCFSVSSTQGSEKAGFTYTRDFELKKFKEIEDFDALIELGFSPTVYTDGYRNKVNSKGLTNLGYIDIDTGVDIETGEKQVPIEKEVFKGWLLYHSGSMKPGKFRVVYKRPFTYEDHCIISDGFIQYRFGEDIHRFEVIKLILELEREWFLGLVPEAVDYFDQTSLNSHMHSKKIGKLIYRNALKSPDIDLYMEAFGSMRASGMSEGVYRCGNYTEIGIHSEFKRVIRDGQESLYMVSGNILEVGVNGYYQKVTIGEAISGRYHLVDPIGYEKTTGFQRYPDTVDAYMPLKITRHVTDFSDTLYCVSWGQHNGNKDKISRIVIKFEAGVVETKYSTEITLDGVDLLIDEKHRTFTKGMK